MWDMPAAGAFIKDRIYSPGKMLPWNEMIEQATGEPLTAKYFVDLYVQ